MHINNDNSSSQKFKFINMNPKIKHRKLNLIRDLHEMNGTFVSLVNMEEVLLTSQYTSPSKYPSCTFISLKYLYYCLSTYSYRHSEPFCLNL